MEYVVGALAGIIYGGLVGVCKYFFIWRGVISPKNDATVSMNQIYMRMLISYGVNVIALLGTYFTRNIIPFDFVAFAIATALTLSVAGRAFPLEKAYRKTKTN